MLDVYHTLFFVNLSAHVACCKKVKMYIIAGRIYIQETSVQNGIVIFFLQRIVYVYGCLMDIFSPAKSPWQAVLKSSEHEY